MWIIYTDDQQYHIDPIIEHPEQLPFFDRDRAFRNRQEPGAAQVIDYLLHATYERVRPL